MGNPLILGLLVIGLVICSKSRRIKSDIIFRNGYWFFLFLLVAAIYDLIFDLLSFHFIEKLIESGLTTSQLGTALGLSQIPARLLELLAFLILVLGFYKYYRGCQSNHLPGK